jgi:hypothetical protein
MSAAPAEQILAALEGAGLVVRELDDGSVNMEGTREGEHGALVVAVEIYELTRGAGSRGGAAQVRRRRRVRGVLPGYSCVLARSIKACPCAHVHRRPSCVA